MRTWTRLVSLVIMMFLGFISLISQAHYKYVFTSKNANLRVLGISQLYLEGSSNVNAFTCHCKQDFSALSAEFRLDEKQRSAHFRDTKLLVKTAMLDCGNKQMNKDLKQTLKADEYPHISIQLDQVDLNIKSNLIREDWTHLIAHTRLTLIDQTNEIKMPVMARRIGEDTLQMKSFYQLSFSDFGIEAPKALLGLIKVHDEIMIHFDLYLKEMR